MQLQLNTSTLNLKFKFHLQAPALAELDPAQPQLVLTVLDFHKMIIFYQGSDKCTIAISFDQTVEFL